MLTETDRRTAETAEAAIVHAAAPGRALYAVLDAAREPLGVAEARAHGLACESLFAGELGEMLDAVAPYLIEFPSGSPLRRWWFEQRGRSIGILVESGGSLVELRRHFRTLLMVRGEENRRYYFRFYDPRVLPTFLSACTPDELRRFFGPMAAIYCEDWPRRGIKRFAIDHQDLLISRDLTAPAKP